MFLSAVVNDAINHARIHTYFPVVKFVRDLVIFLQPKRHRFDIKTNVSELNIAEFE